MPTTVLQANPPPPSIFRPCDGPIMEMNKSLIAISTGIKHVKSSQYLPSIRSMKFLSMSLSVFMEIKILDWPFFAVDQIRSTFAFQTQTTDQHAATTYLRNGDLFLMELHFNCHTTSIYKFSSSIDVKNRGFLVRQLWIVNYDVNCLSNM